MIESIEHVGTHSSAWESAVSADEATIFHTPAWMELLEDVYGVKNRTVRVTLSDGRGVVVPLALRNKSGGLPERIINLYASTPLGFYGGVVGDDVSGKEECEILEKLGSREVRGLRPKTFSSLTNPLKDAGGERFTQIVSLTEDAETIMDNHKDNARRAFEDARDDENLSLRNECDVEAFMHLYRKNLERWDDPKHVYSADMFETMLSVLPDEATEMFFVDHDEYGAVSGQVNLYHNEHVYMFMSAYDHDYRSLNGNNYSFTHSMKKAGREGYKYYDLGPSAGNKGLIRFKSSFGAEKFGFREVKVSNKAFKLGSRLHG